jgi:hypothetical protein
MSPMINFLHLRIYSNPVLPKETLNLGFLILLVHGEPAQCTLTLLFWPKREEVTGGCRESHEFFSSKCYLSDQIKEDEMSWAYGT